MTTQAPTSPVTDQIILDHAYAQNAWNDVVKAHYASFGGQSMPIPDAYTPILTALVDSIIAWDRAGGPRG